MQYSITDVTILSESRNPIEKKEKSYNFDEDDDVIIYLLDNFLKESLPDFMSCTKKEDHFVIAVFANGQKNLYKANFNKQTKDITYERMETSD